jgi:cell division protease FtsH
MAGGYTLALPKEEKRMKTKSEFLAEISVLLGGFCAERIKFKEISTGASQDLEKATALARNLVTKYGMSKLGPVTFGIRESSPFLGLEIEAEKNYSEKTAALIDKETVSFIKEAEKRTMNLLKNKKKLLEKIAQRLMEKEMIEKEEFEKIIKDSK